MILTAAVQRAEAAQLTHSCRVHASFLEFMPPHQESRWSFYRCFVLCWGGRSCLPPCCYPCCCNYSVVWGIFGLTCCIPFASPRDWNKSKHYGLQSGKLIALDVYVLVFTELDCTVWSLPGCIWLSVVCFFFMCSVRSCVQSCRKHKTQNIKIILTVAEELNVCL